MADTNSSPPLLSMSLVSPNSHSSSNTEEHVNQGFTRVVNRRNSNRNNFPARRNVSTNNLEPKVSFFLLVLITWAFAWMYLICGVYAPRKIWIGPNSAILIEPNFFLVETVKVTELAKSNSSLELFGFHRTPLDVLINWSESRVLSISHKSLKNWSYYLNQGTSLNISYSIKPEGSSVELVVKEVLPFRDITWLSRGYKLEGKRGITQLPNKDDHYRDTAFSWNQIEGNGMIELNINQSSSYSFSVINFNMKDVKVGLDIDVRSVLYDTKEPFYKCTLSSGDCTYNARSFIGNSLVLTSPAPSEGVSMEEEWCIMLSYEPRVFTYVVGTLVVICYAVVGIKLFETLKCCGGERRQTEGDPEMSSQRTHLLENKDEDSSSVDSSNESLAADDDDLEDFVGNEGDASNSNKRLCVICFDSPRDCFFIHCGHCVSCFKCGKKVAETSGSCPICRRKIKKVKRIYTV